MQVASQAGVISATRGGALRHVAATAVDREGEALSLLQPDLMLARELGNFLYWAQAELQRRDEWRPDYLESV